MASHYKSNPPTSQTSPYPLLNPQEHRIQIVKDPFDETFPATKWMPFGFIVGLGTVYFVHRLEGKPMSRSPFTTIFVPLITGLSVYYFKEYKEKELQRKKVQWKRMHIEMEKKRWLGSMGNKPFYDFRKLKEIRKKVRPDIL